ncbi:MAG: SAM-dependent methyltransferase, partial [Streptosporangiaceae bacterium]
MTESEHASPGADVTRPSPARMYDYFLGGTHNYAADRAAADRLIAQLRDPADAADGAWASRAFHQRAARWMADECGIRQFIDIGSGLPTQNNT